MNTPVNGTLPVLVWFHGRSYLHFSNLYYFLIWTGGANRRRLRFWEHASISSRFVNNFFIQSSYLRVVWISSWTVWILGSVYHVCIDMDSISSSFKEEARYMIMEVSTLVFLIRYSTVVNIQKAVLLMHPREQHLNGFKDIFITLVVILGYLIVLHKLQRTTHYNSFFLVENSQVTIWGQSAGAGSVMFHVSCTRLSKD